ncbi:ferric reductase transmembrane component 7 [Scheffersomyces coipomensis]|uniref:ferric reductase transmembrane component 7 n=1 Tax=Scheffersomyces coipomensis TaxID=1788519 RepID=UPI00315D6050
MFKRGVEYEGMDCLKDMTSAEYTAAGTVSQTEVAWMAQGKYGYYTVYFGAAVIGCALVKHLWYLYRDFSYKRNRVNVISPFIDVFVAYSRYLGYKQIPARISYFTSLPPSLGSTLFMFLSSVYLFCYSLVPHFWYRGCFGFGSPPLAVRSGIMAGALTPFIYILAGKANMITFLTGISYEKLNQYHQFVGVACFVLSVIHTIPFIYQPLVEGGTSNLRYQFTTDFQFYSGIPPLIILGWLVIASKAWFRKICYEFFLHAHWLFGIAYFGTLIWHINKTLNYDDYMWGALGFWASQLIYRALVKTAFKPNTLFLRPRIAKLLKLSDNAYQISIANTKGYKWKPGQHCFLRFVGSRILDNHPFSIASMIDNDSKEMKFLIVPKKGLTKKIYDELDEFVVKEKKVYIDGPYGGTTRDPTAFDRIILLASGSGVTATLPFLLFMANEIKESQTSNKRVVTQLIDFVWIVRHKDNINWIKDELTKCKNIAGDKIRITIYISRDGDENLSGKDVKDGIELSNIDDVEQYIENSESDSDIPDLDINILPFKPSITRLVEDLKGSLSRRNFIVSSGSESMKAQVSAAVSNLQALIFNNDYNHSYIEEIYLHTESFGW